MLYSNGKPDGMAAPDLTAARGRRVLIALSGGADSVALAVLLSEAQRDCALTLFAAHIDHGIRPESAEDAAFCRDLCHALGIPFYSARLDVPGEARAQGEGLESTARRMRYAQLRRTIISQKNIQRLSCIASSGIKISFSINYIDC